MRCVRQTIRNSPGCPTLYHTQRQWQQDSWDNKAVALARKQQTTLLPKGFIDDCQISKADKALSGFHLTKYARVLST